MKVLEAVCLPMLTLSVLAGLQNNNWMHLSTARGDLAPPNSGKQQTSATVFDINKDGTNDFVITERTEAPSVVWYRRTGSGWERGIIDAGKLQIEAGSGAFDVDGDGDLDFVAGGDGSSNQIWWWENPAPRLDPAVPWRRFLIKNDGANKHHDQAFGDVDGDGKQEFVFWNQGGNRLCLAEIPANPKAVTSWPYETIYTYSGDSEPEQRGKADSFKKVGEHEGLAVADIDGDGVLDIVGGGRWFKHTREGKFLPNVIDANYTFTRAAAGQIRSGGRPEVVLVVGDGVGPLIWYEWVRGVWIPHPLMEVRSGHSMSVGDYNGDGHADIFFGEMRLHGANPRSRVCILYGNGEGEFRLEQIAEGYGVHEAKIADLDGDGSFDILGKPYNWETPRLDLWLQGKRN